MEFKRAVLSQESISLLESYSACKGAKTLLVKNAAEAHLTYEELLTLLTVIESILNSRPIAPLSDDPNDGFALTPAHLLIGGPLLSAPEEHLQVSSATDDASQLNSLTRWQRITFLKQQFWRIWQRDYIHTLQKRTKFTQPQDNIRVGQLVIIHEDTAPPQHWNLAPVTAVISGKDDRVRVVDLKTNKRTPRRPIHKIAPLPVECS
ncbi:uncharacterized protein [Drosophila takahashii]|uniref:uncharacterized protein n=1 Tax=Drosophila takahashii TaxID=29030 RepID=UPI003898F44E